MKNFFVLLLMLFFGLSLTSNAQDILYKTDGSKEEVKVLEITQKEITYKKFSNPDGPSYVIDKGQVALIAFSNGEHELITGVKDVKEAKPAPAIDYTKDFTRNSFAFHMFDVIFGDIAVSYEHISADGRIGLKVPLAFGFYGIDPYNTPFEFNNLFYSGMALNFYPSGQGRFRYFVGPQFRIGVGRYDEYIYYYDEYGNYYDEESYTNSSLYLKYFVDNGITFMATKNLSLSAILSLGIRYVASTGQYMNTIQPDGQFAINLGLRF